MPAKLPDSIAAYYTGFLKNGVWRLDCKAQGCAQKWDLTEAGAAKVGNVLRLLDHGRSHDARSARKGAR